MKIYLIIIVFLISSAISAQTTIHIHGSELSVNVSGSINRVVRIAVDNIEPETDNTISTNGSLIYFINYDDKYTIIAKWTTPDGKEKSEQLLECNLYTEVTDYMTIELKLMIMNQ